MQQHTGQHVLSQAFLKELNGNTESFHLGTDSSTIDLSLESLTKEELYQVEDCANRIVFENRMIHTHFRNSEDLQDFPLRGESDKSGVLRIIEIEDFDYTFCGGTHCRSTGEAGLIKIKRWERAKRKVRVEFICGWRALLDYRRKHRTLYRLSKKLSISTDDVIGAVESRIERERELQRQVRAQEKQLLLAEASQLIKEAEARGQIRIAKKVLSEGDVKTLNRLATMVLESGDDWIVLLGSEKPRPTLLFARSKNLDRYDLRDWLSLAAPFVNGRGGGTPDRVQAGGTRPEGLENALHEALSSLDE
jgi:alanyl-tRNA synthetase